MEFNCGVIGLLADLIPGCHMLSVKVPFGVIGQRAKPSLSCLDRWIFSWRTRSMLLWLNFGTNGWFQTGCELRCPGWKWCGLDADVGGFTLQASLPCTPGWYLTSWDENGLSTRSIGIKINIVQSAPTSKYGNNLVRTFLIKEIRSFAYRFDIKSVFCVLISHYVKCSCSFSTVKILHRCPFSYLPLVRFTHGSYQFFHTVQSHCPWYEVVYPAVESCYGQRLSVCPFCLQPEPRPLK